METLVALLIPKAKLVPPNVPGGRARRKVVLSETIYMLKFLFKSPDRALACPRLHLPEWILTL